MVIKLPSILAVNESIVGNTIQQIAESGCEREGSLPTFTRGRIIGFLFRPAEDNDEILIISKTKQIPDGYPRIIQATVNAERASVDISDGLWVKHPLINSSSDMRDREREIQQVLASWVSAFSYVQEDPEQDKIGLRGPQIGAIHAVHAHWAVSDAPATIVLPTGTGKTETMLSILVSARCSKVLVVVPTDALRRQITNKFLTLGILKHRKSAVLSSTVRHPIVCTLQHIPRSVQQVDDIFLRSQVIVMTSSIAAQCETAVQERMAYHCPYLFIDEAHHAEAPTWSVFKERFRERRVLQFTATPFREDGKPLEGDLIFRYPLKKAQQEGYFTSIQFEPVVEFNLHRSDEAIARKAIAQLRVDAERGHILMARVGNVKRANEVFALYNQYPEFNPVQLHTGIKSLRQREEIRRKIITGESRIVVCVDMLGEGFDLPQLKIAAFHDIRKTLAVTLQLAGRFTRARPELGDATFIANTADVNVQDELRKLYSRDPDWNSLLPQLSDRMVGEQVSLQEFLRGFTEFTKEIPLKNVRPATSAVVYRTMCAAWTPENFRAGIPSLNTCAQVHETINHANHTLVIVTARQMPLAWTNIDSVYNWEWELYVVIWSPEQSLLFINSSSNSGEYKALAQAVAGESAILVKGQDVFRTFAGVNRLRLQNVGLTEQLGRNVRYTGRMGADVGPGVPEVRRQRALKSVMAGSGYEGGEKATVGASRKGRIWSQRRERIDQLAGWCKAIGMKLLDNSIDPDELLKGTLEAKTILKRPLKMPIAIDWPEEMYTSQESIWTILIGAEEYSLGELSLELVNPNPYGRLQFAICSETTRVEVALELLKQDEIPNYRFIVSRGEPSEMLGGGRVGAKEITEFFYNNPPVIWFSDGSALEGNQYVELKSAYPPYDSGKVLAWDWAGINIRKESQGECKDQNSVQARVIRELRSRNYDMIVDDDGKGEAADVVAIRLQGELTAPSAIDVEFYHCKYSQTETPGQRIKDLYEVCGQAQKSIFWMSSPEKRTDLFTHILRREAKRQFVGSSTRYEVGNGELLQTIREISRLCLMSLKIFIVQPGVSKSNMTRDQLELLSVTENHLMETYQIPFGVIASE
ncbi:MAG: DEAD/DEAH box helicase family protein [Nitrospirales bacterium]|nr:DEAD/DEAH box helicase family protein [Nitrospirales bacterium]